MALVSLDTSKESEEGLFPAKYESASAISMFYLIVEATLQTFLMFTYVTCFIITWVLVYQRAGFSDIKAEQGIDWREFLLGNIPWFALTLLKVWFWFVTIGVWLLQGRPSSHWRAVTRIDGRPVRKIVRTR